MCEPGVRTKEAVAHDCSQHEPDFYLKNIIEACALTFKHLISVLNTKHFSIWDGNRQTGRAVCDSLQVDFHIYHLNYRLLAALQFAAQGLHLSFPTNQCIK